MDSNSIMKTLDLVNNVSKLAANVTEKKAEKPTEKTVYREGAKTQTNQPHNQTVEIKVGDPDAKPVEEKHETHVHQTFPENRELSERECEIEKLRLTQEHEREMARIRFEIESAEYERKRREYEDERREKERAERREEDKKWSKRALIAACIFGGVCIGGAGYEAWRDYKNGQKRENYVRISYNPSGNGGAAPVAAAEGSVE